MKPRRQSIWGGAPRVLAAVALALAAIDLVLRLALPPDPRALLEVELLPRAAYHGAGQRLAGALADLGEDPRQLAVIAGLSSVREGIDPAQMDARDPQRRWLVLATGGGMFRQVAHLMSPVTAHHVRPSVVVLGVASSWIADVTDDALVHERMAWAEHRGPVQRAIWSWRNANLLSLGARHLMQRARERLLPAFGVTPAAMYGRSERPWTGLWQETEPHGSPGHLADQIGGWKARGWFRPEMYRPDGDEGRSLAGLLDALAADGVRVLIVLMPVSPTWRAHTPPQADDALAAVLRGRIPDDDVLDLRDSLPAAELFDHSHANATGRVHTTDRVIAWVLQRCAAAPCGEGTAAATNGSLPP